MAEINDWDVLADGNAVAPPNGFPENMDYSDVNNSSREVMAVLARSYRDQNGSLDATGINDVVISTNSVYPEYYQGLRIGFRAANTNTAAMTLQLNALSPAPLLNTAGGPMESGSVIADLIHFAVYNGSAFQLVTNGFEFPGGNPGIFTAAAPDVAPEGVDRVALLDVSDGSAPKFATISAIRQATELFNLDNPAAAPTAQDRFHFQDADDLNLPKTATLQQMLNIIAPNLENGDFTLLGVNGAVADTTNRFSVRSASSLFDAIDASEGGTGDTRIIINREAVNDNASLVFQTGLSALADLGLMADDNFRIRVSPDNFTTIYEPINIDNASGRIGVNGAPDTSAMLKVTGADGSNPANGDIHLEKSGSGSFPIFMTTNYTSGSPAEAPFNIFRRARGSVQTPASVQSGDDLGGIAFRGYSNGSFIQRALIRAQVDGAVSGSSVPTKLTFFTGATGVATRLEILSNGSVVVGSPTGGGQGAGTLNASGVYDDGSLLTCYVFDQALDGEIDLEAWDKRAPGLHEPLRKFADRAGTEHDPLDMDAYAAHWRDKRHLTSMPNKAHFDHERGLSTGQWIQRLVETVEIQAVHIDQLNRRLKELEGTSSRTRLQP